MRNGDEGCAEYEMREAEAHEAEMEAAAGAEGEAMAEAEEQEMTDPVREEMMRRLRNHDSLVVVLEDKFHAELGGRNVVAIRDEITQERQDFLTDLLRVIRGHMEGRWLNFEKDSREYKLVADYALHQTLESLPEEK